MTPGGLFVIAALGIFCFMTLQWLASLALRNSSIVDIFWGTGFVLVHWMGFFMTPAGVTGRKWILGVLVTFWGLRLSLHILWRNWGKGEDFRYRKWREQAGSGWWWRSFFKVFLLQGILMWIISAPLLAGQMTGARAGLNLIDLAAIPVWVLGFFFEAAGDWQLARFKRDPGNRGKVLRSGVWRYTRHPNYFGDALQWWAYYLMAISGGGYWTVFSPILMTFLLLRVSGVALLEESLKATKPGYREYVDATNAFFPWFPHR